MDIAPSRAPGSIGWMMVAIFVALPALSVGFYGDDLYALAVLEGRVDRAGWMDVYREADAVGGMGEVQGDHFPWWASDTPRPRWLRPIAAASLALDHALFGLDARAYHVSQMAIFVLVLLLAVRVFHDLGGPRGASIAVVAGLLFALDEVHSVALGQISARHALLGAMFGLLAWMLHRAGRRGWALVPLAFAVASSETAATIGAWFVAEAVVLRSGPWRKRARAVAPAATLCAAFAILHAGSGFGPRWVGSAAHLEQLVGVRLPVLAGALFAPVRPERLTEAAGGEMLAAGCVLLIAVVAALLRPVWRQDRGVRFAVLALGLGLPWLAFDEPSSVGLVLPSVLAAWLLARVAVHYARARSTRIVAGVVLLTHAVLAPALHLREVSRLAERTEREERAAATVPRLPDARVLLLTSPAGVDADLPLRVMLDAHRPAGIWLLSLSLESHGLWQPEDGGVELSGELLVRQRERRWMGDEPLGVGDTRRRGALEVVVVEATAEHVNKIAVRLDVPPDDVWLLARDGDGYRALELPERGGAVTLPRARELEVRQP